MVELDGGGLRTAVIGVYTKKISKKKNNINDTSTKTSKKKK